MTCAVVLAAGSGRRFQGLKQFAELGGKRLVDHAVEAVAQVADAVILVLPPDVAWDGRPVTTVVGGGLTRSASVRAGLAALPRATEIIVIHDAAHPLARPALFEAVIEQVELGADGAVPIIPIAETIGRCAGNQLMTTTPAEGAVLVQMPHAFRAAVLRDLYAGGLEARDEASLLVQAGRTVCTVPGDPGNLHIASWEDLGVAMRLLTGKTDRAAPG